MGQPNILAVLARVYVDDLDAAVPLYQQLTGAEPSRFDYQTMRLARVGQFLLVQGADDSIREHRATLAVRDLDQVVAAVTSAGGTVLDGPAPGPNGLRAVIRHHDGNIYEYVQVG